MTKTCLGIDIGKTQMKLALIKGEKVLKCATVQMPEGLYKDGKIVSVESMGELLRETMKKNNMSCKEAAVILPSQACYLRNTVMPNMTEEQMRYNLPYEFKDFITDELKNYAFDYVEHARTEEGINVLGVAASLKAIEDLRIAVRKAGLRLKVVSHEVFACEALLYKYLRDRSLLKDNKEYAILDLGSNTSRLMIFTGHCHQVTRSVDMGMEHVEECIADAYNIDIHLAHTWLLTNHEDCVHSEACQEAFSRISIEIMRALNFYRFSNPNSSLSEIMVCGNNEATEAVKVSLKENLDAEIVDAACLLDGMGSRGSEKISSLYLQAIGVALNGNIKSEGKVVNLADAGVEKKHYALAVPAVIAIILGTAAIAKFAVADRLMEVSYEQGQTAAVQAQIDEANAYIESLGDLQKIYAHYTYQGFTEDEIKCMNRPEVMELLKDVVFPKAIVSNWSLDGNQLTLPVQRASLAEINSLIRDLEAQEIVDYCSVSTAVNESERTVDGEVQGADTVTGQITVYLKTELSEEMQQIVGGTDN